jgi:hypothetical protein
VKQQRLQEKEVKQNMIPRIDHNGAQHREKDTGMIQKKNENEIANGKILLKKKNGVFIAVKRATAAINNYVQSVLRFTLNMSKHLIGKLKKPPSTLTEVQSAPVVVNLILNSCRSTISAEGGIFIERSFAEATAIAGAVGSVYIFGSNGTITRKDLEFSAETATALTANWATALTSGSV